MEEETITLRRYGQREQETMPLAAFQERLMTAIRTRSQDI